MSSQSWIVLDQLAYSGWRVVSHCDRKMVMTENKKIRVAMAFISGVAPRRRRDQISRGSVFSLPMRKKVTAISSMERVKTSSAVPSSEVLQAGQDNAYQGLHPAGSQVGGGLFQRAIELGQAG